MHSLIYLDNAATTKTDPRVLDAMLPYWREEYGNPSSIYQLGSRAKSAVENARSQIAAIFHAQPKEIYFTSCGTESDNWAIIAYALANRTKGNHIITSKIEHHAILHSCEWLEKQGYDVTYLDVDEYGMVQLEDFRNAIRPDTIMASVMFANNEIGTIQPIRELAAIAKEKDIFFHTDAVQAVGNCDIFVDELGIDAFSLSAHKIHGPKGIGLLYVHGSFFYKHADPSFLVQYAAIDQKINPFQRGRRIDPIICRDLCRRWNLCLFGKTAR
jgi:cysteine desulfurase